MAALNSSMLLQWKSMASTSCPSYPHFLQVELLLSGKEQIPNVGSQFAEWVDSMDARVRHLRSGKRGSSKTVTISDVQPAASINTAQE
jgi:hypothetical protein